MDKLTVYDEHQRANEYTTESKLITMTKNEAIRALRRGARLTHKFFGPDEWIELRKGQIVNEEGYKTNMSAFFADRIGYAWEGSWEIVPAQSKINALDETN